MPDSLSLDEFDRASEQASSRAVEALAEVVSSFSGQSRPGQDEMAAVVAETLFAGGVSVIQAGTGTGKSAGYLVPAALASAGKPVIVSTATLALQRQLTSRELPRIADALEPIIGRRLSFAVLKGRSNYVCKNKLTGPAPTEELELFSSASSSLSSSAVSLAAWASSSETGDRDDYSSDVDPRVWRSFSATSKECPGEQSCPFGQECFTALARAKAHAADIVVTNHSMLAIEHLVGVSVLPPHDAVIVDEAHELQERTAAALSLSLSAPMVERALRRASSYLSAESAAAWKSASSAFEVALWDMAASRPGRVTVLSEDLELALGLLVECCRSALADISDATDPDPASVTAAQYAKGAVEEVFEAASAFSSFGSDSVVFTEQFEARDPALRLTPLSVASALAATLFQTRSAILTSATLTTGSSFAPVLRDLGLTNDTCSTLDVASPFDYSKQGILYVAAHLPRPAAGVSSPELLEELGDLIEAAGGRTLALFSSWKAVDAAASYLAARFAGRTDLPLLVQRKGDPVSSLVSRFADEHSSTLLGTLSLWQGVDVPGASCSLVVLDKIPFPRPDDPVIQARSRVFEEAGASGFASVSVPKAGLLLAQGAGRLIRSSSDRGVVAVLDPRLANSSYAAQLRACMPPLWFTTDKPRILASLAALATSLD